MYKYSKTKIVVSGRTRNLLSHSAHGVKLVSGISGDDYQKVVRNDYCTSVTPPFLFFPPANDENNPVRSDEEWRVLRRISK